MDNPGPQQLTIAGGAFQIAGPATLQSDVIGGQPGGVDLTGAVSATIQAKFSTGLSAGVSVTVYIQTSLDQGNSWVDIACFGFTNVNASPIVNLSGLTPRTAPVAPTYQGLTPGYCVDGVLGDRFQAIAVVEGTYVGAVLNLTMMLR